MSLNQVKKIMGTIVDPAWTVYSNYDHEDSLEQVELPETFNSND